MISVTKRQIQHWKSVADIMFILFALRLRLNECVNTIYIHHWTTVTDPSTNLLGVGRTAFTKRKCEFKNCFISYNPRYLGNITKFDAVVFNADRINSKVLPRMRSPNQLYIFMSQKSSVCNPMPAIFNGYFNWTWTYRFDSEIGLRHITVADRKRNIIGPRKNMHWIKFVDMSPVMNNVKDRLRHKGIACVWFANNCNNFANRYGYVMSLQKELAKYGQRLDIYGKCGSMMCPNQKVNCAVLTENYYFYLAFEDYFTKDYVSEKVLDAFKYYSVPIVYGGANYTSFLPESSYLDAAKIDAASLAKKIVLSIHNEDVYHDFFRWRPYYQFLNPRANAVTDPVCEFCAALNDKTKRSRQRIYYNFTQWWNVIGVFPYYRRIVLEPTSIYVP